MRVTDVDARDRPSVRRSTRKRPTDDDLLDAARSIVAEVGVERTTMDMVAERGDTTRVTLYAHFGARDGLIDRLIERETGMFADWMFRSYDQSADLPFGGRARHAVESLFEYVRVNPDGLRVLLGHRQEGDHAGRQLYGVLEPRIATLLRENLEIRGHRIGPGVDALASMLMGISLDIAHRAVIVDGASVDAARDLAMVATLAVLSSVEPAHLEAIDRSVDR